MRKVDTAERFWAKVNVLSADECWEWTVRRFRDGYGQFWLDGTPTVAHRVAYTLTYGAVPEGLELDHTCRNKACVNPRHLDPVTAKVNTHRFQEAAGRGIAVEECPSGHPYSEDNTYRHAGRRHCRQCVRDAGARYRARRKAAA